MSVLCAAHRINENNITRVRGPKPRLRISPQHQITCEIAFGFKIHCGNDNKAEIGTLFRLINSKNKTHCASQVIDVPRVHVHTHTYTHTHTQVVVHSERLNTVLLQLNTGQGSSSSPPTP